MKRNYIDLRAFIIVAGKPIQHLVGSDLVIQGGLQIGGDGGRVTGDSPETKRSWKRRKRLSVVVNCLSSNLLYIVVHHTIQMFHGSECVRGCVLVAFDVFCGLNDRRGFPNIFN